MKTRATHLSDGELLVISGGDVTDARGLNASAHVGECVTCRERLAELEQLFEAARLAMGDERADGQHHAESRVQLGRALTAAADEWQRSWWFRLRVALAGARVYWMVPAIVVTMAIAVSLFERVTVVPPVHSAGDVSAAWLPIARLTPGAVTALTTRELCDGATPSRRVSAADRAQVLRNYHMEGVPESAYELDALITPELGGSTDQRNLWPQRYDSPVWNARVKDEIERLLPQLVCDGRVDLARAQREIATDWVGAYKKYFATDRPLVAHITGPAPLDDDQLQIVLNDSNFNLQSSIFN